MTALKEAQESGDLTDLITEQDAKLKGVGDLDRLDAFIRCPDRGKSKEAQAASKPHTSDD
jgi:hypothetical protein